MPKCVYCAKIYDGHKGITLIMKNGKINHLCSSKCQKNMLMKRRNVKWISKAKVSKEDLRKELLVRSAEKEEVKEAKEEAAKEASKIEEKKEVGTDSKEKPADK